VNILRLSTLNLWHDSCDWRARLDNTAGWVETAGIDVLCVQEIIEQDGQPTSVLLAGLSGMHLATPLGDNGVDSTTAVLVRDPSMLRSSELVSMTGHSEAHVAPFAAVCELETTAGLLPVASVHLAWGSLQEAARLKQLQHLSSWFDNRLGYSEQEAPAIIAGDFNTWPDSESVRYVKGRTAHAPATLWTDAWDHNTHECDGTTSSGANPFAAHTAMTYREGRDGIIMEGLLPDRRIDYVLSRGWRHGRVFTPTNTHVVREPLMSDHYAVVTDLLLG
jgi:endonuclease/exonuclease/phosphatase family metal-dependent hydrolase